MGGNMLSGRERVGGADAHEPGLSARGRRVGAEETRKVGFAGDGQGQGLEGSVQVRVGECVAECRDEVVQLHFLPADHSQQDLGRCRVRHGGLRVGWAWGAAGLQVSGWRRW